MPARLVLDVMNTLPPREHPLLAEVEEPDRRLAGDMSQATGTIPGAGARVARFAQGHQRLSRPRVVASRAPKLADLLPLLAGCLLALVALVRRAPTPARSTTLGSQPPAPESDSGNAHPSLASHRAHGATGTPHSTACHGRKSAVARRRAAVACVPRKGSNVRRDDAGGPGDLRRAGWPPTPGSRRRGFGLAWRLPLRRGSAAQTSPARFAGRAQPAPPERIRHRHQRGN